MMLNLITQQGDFVVYINDHKCYTSLDICGGITDCLTGEFIVKYKNEDIFQSRYNYETWSRHNTFKLHYDSEIYHLPRIKSILRHMPKKGKILKGVLNHKKN